jgi:hypothetical protein
MVLSNAERQARYRQKLKDAAVADVQVLVGIADMNARDRNVIWLPATLPSAPMAGDNLVVQHGDGEWTAKVVSRTIRERGAEGPSLVIHCEGRFNSHVED